MKKTLTTSIALSALLAVVSAQADRRTSRAIARQITCAKLEYILKDIPGELERQIRNVKEMVAAGDHELAEQSAGVLVAQYAYYVRRSREWTRRRCRWSKRQ